MAAMNVAERQSNHGRRAKGGVVPVVVQDVSSSIGLSVISTSLRSCFCAGFFSMSSTVEELGFFIMAGIILGATLGILKIFTAICRLGRERVGLAGDASYEDRVTWILTEKRRL